MKPMNGNGVGDAFPRWLLGVVAVLMAAGVIGLWSMTQTLTRLEERVASWTRVFEARFEETSRGLSNVRERAIKMESILGTMRAAQLRALPSRVRINQPTRQLWSRRQG